MNYFNTDTPLYEFDYKPVFFNLKKTEDKLNFHSLLKDNKSVTKYDKIRHQLYELIKIRHPNENFTEKDLEEKIKTELKGSTLEEYGNWVYYPWSNSLVHILGEEEYIEVRTNRNLYKITREEREILRHKKVGIIGLSVGQSIALTLAMERVCGEIRLADFDDIELSNLNRIRSSIENLGLPKVIVAAREIFKIDPYIKLKCYISGITEVNIEDFLLGEGQLDVLIEECDSIDIKFFARKKAKESGIPVIMETSDRGLLDIERFDLERDRPLFHGISGDIDYLDVKKLDAKEKYKLIMKIVDFDNLSERAKYSISEVGKSIRTWPQLASSVIQGGGVVTDVARRILLGELRNSGRYYIDLNKLIK